MSVINSMKETSLKKLKDWMMSTEIIPTVVRIVKSAHNISSFSMIFSFVFTQKLFEGITVNADAI